MSETVYTVTPRKLVETEVAPVQTEVLGDGAMFIDFGRAAYGTMVMTLPQETARESLVVHLGEKLSDDDRIDREPGGTIRYCCIEQSCSGGMCRIVIPPDERNTKQPAAILMPDYIGEVYPFRYAEIEDGSDIPIEGIRQVAVHYPFDDDASTFESSDEILNAVWELCKYSIKATSFCGVYVDGDRERIPYEGDAYINQLGHYCVDSEYAMGRYSHEYMIQNPTWCTEWHLHSVMMAWADYMYSGETTSLERFYDELRVKTLIDFAREDGLISVDPELRTAEMSAKLAPHFDSGIIKENIRDVMDWPPGSFTDGGTGERDNHEMLPINTVTNAFHCHALRLMSRIAGALDNDSDRERFAARADRVAARINEILFEESRGIYMDGEGAAHASLHSNMFMLAFELVPEERRAGVIDFVKSRGMACSVYGSQHLLDALYQYGEDDYALGLMTATHDRGWWNMLQAGSTVTLEAWDVKYKKNLDWNHAWGAAPANVIPRHLVGVQPLGPGFARAVIKPQPGTLSSFSAKVPTPKGPVAVSLMRRSDAGLELEVTIPNGMTADLVLPSVVTSGSAFICNGEPTIFEQRGEQLVKENLPPGCYVIQSAELQ